MMRIFGFLFLLATSSLAQAANPFVASIDVTYDGGWPHLSQTEGRFIIQGEGGVHFNAYDAYFALNATMNYNNGDSSPFFWLPLEANKVRMVYNIEFHLPVGKKPIFKAGLAGTNSGDKVVFQRKTRLATYADSNNPLTACTVSAATTASGNYREIFGGIDGGGHHAGAYPPVEQYEIQAGFLNAPVPGFRKSGRFNSNGEVIWIASVQAPSAGNSPEENINVGASGTAAGGGQSVMYCSAMGKWVYRLVKLGPYTIGGEF